MRGFVVAVCLAVGGCGLLGGGSGEKFQDLSFGPPEGFKQTKTTANSVTWQGTLGAEKVPTYLEHWSFKNPGLAAKDVAAYNAIPIDKQKQICPDIGRITTCVAEKQGSAGAATVFSIRQISSVNHTPMRAMGYLVMGKDKVYVSRMVTPQFGTWETTLPAEMAKIGLTYKGAAVAVK
jgi:hypothetical protein